MQDRKDGSMLLHGFLREILNVDTEEELDALAQQYLPGAEGQEDLLRLFEDGLALGREMVCLKKSGADAVRGRRLAALSEQERRELEEAERVIDENRLEYHFQPIVSARYGVIYSYEALMRPKSSLCPSPFHILKYAELTGRLSDIERATFLNVLGLIDSDKERFHGRKVFVNSIPRTKLSTEDLRKIGELLVKHSGSVAVELTEQAEPDEEELNALKERYRNMDVPIAIDDYGTGYSNVNNLLRYMPEYVKIDRSLISGIQDSHKKRHFVREIIGFCHENGIMALAEGVETSEELREVILMGVDLIQGYYTARPSAEVAESIPYEISREIRRYRQERDDGRGQQIYAADSTENILLSRLVKEDLRTVIVGSNGGGEVCITGTQDLDTQIHIETVKGFKGTVVLENVRLSNLKGRPCIDIGEESETVIRLVGDNHLDLGGIRVPESSKLTVAGEGDLHIELDTANYYGIGNDIGFFHGEMYFKQSGCISVTAHGQTGVAIGSGDGGKIFITAGQYKFDLSGDTGLGIGALYGDTDLDIRTCDINLDFAVSKGVGIGSIVNDCRISFTLSSAKIFMAGSELVGMGTIAGTMADIHIFDASTVFNMRGAKCSAIAAIDGSTRLLTERAGLRITSGGDRALALGGMSVDQLLHLSNADTNIKLESGLDHKRYINEDTLKVTMGRCRYVLNGKEILSQG
ncbi:MAG: EAL domain-containing protein [Ruminococcus sp.]|nr:EAL domain-containing protein [Ruminococcus sp.]